MWLNMLPDQYKFVCYQDKKTFKNSMMMQLVHMLKPIRLPMRPLIMAIRSEESLRRWISRQNRRPPLSRRRKMEFIQHNDGKRSQIWTPQCRLSRIVM